MQTFLLSIPNFTRGVKKSEIWPQFSTQVALQSCFETQQHV